MALGAIWYIAFFVLNNLSRRRTLSRFALGRRLHWLFMAGKSASIPIPHIRRETRRDGDRPNRFHYIFAHWMMGWASAPYDPLWQQRYPRRAAWMALAGPVANFSLAIIAGLSIRIGMIAGVFRAPDSADFTHITVAAVPGFAEFAATFLSILFILNVLLGTFNLLPVPPLDGNTAITLLMSESAGRRFLDWTRNQGFGMAGLLLAWVRYDRIFDLPSSGCPSPPFLPGLVL